MLFRHFDDDFEPIGAVEEELGVGADAVFSEEVEGSHGDAGLGVFFLVGDYGERVGNAC